MELKGLEPILDIIDIHKSNVAGCCSNHSPINFLSFLFIFLYIFLIKSLLHKYVFPISFLYKYLKIQKSYLAKDIKINQSQNEHLSIYLSIYNVIRLIPKDWNVCKDIFRKISLHTLKIVVRVQRYV